MLSFTDLHAFPCGCFVQRRKIKVFHRQLLFLASVVTGGILLSQQPVSGQQHSGQQHSAETGENMIESQAHYSFSMPNTERTGSSQPVLIERIVPEPERSYSPIQSFSSVNLLEMVESVETVEDAENVE